MSRAFALSIGVSAMISSSGCARASAVGSTGGSAEEIDELCKTRVCRPAGEQTIPIDATHAYVGVYDRSPIVVRPGVLSILPGESFEFDATVGEDGVLENIRVVEADGKFSVSLRNGVITNNLSSTMLSVDSTFDRPMRYCAYIDIPGTGLVKTSIVGVGAEMAGTESWSDLVIEVVMTELQLTDTQQECR